MRIINGFDASDMFSSWNGVLQVERWLEVFSEYIACVCLTGHSPDPHFAIDVVLTDDIMADDDGSVFIHVGLGGDMFGGLVVSIEEIVWCTISIEL